MIHFTPRLYEPENMFKSHMASHMNITPRVLSSSLLSPALVSEALINLIPTAEKDSGEHLQVRATAPVAPNPIPA